MTWFLYGDGQQRVRVSRKYGWVQVPGLTLGRVWKDGGRWYAETSDHIDTGHPDRHGAGYRRVVHPVGVGTPERRRIDAVRDIIRHMADAKGEPWREVGEKVKPT